MAENKIVATTPEAILGGLDVLAGNGAKSNVQRLTIQGLVAPSHEHPEYDKLQERVYRLENVCIGLVELLAEYGIEAGPAETETPGGA